MESAGATPTEFAMNIRPTSTPASFPGDAGALKRATPGAREKDCADAAPETPRVDAVELSQDALTLQAGRDATASSEIAPERLKSVLDRISSGYYDRPEIRDRILERLASDLENAE
jgi:hypothetical protein